MVVKNTSDGWDIVTQTNHALLAAQIANELLPKYKEHFWLETCLSISSHETLETDFNSGEKINDLGMPIDFRQNESSKSDLYNKIESMVFKARNKSLIIAALVSKHLLFLHQKDINKKKVENLCINTIKAAQKIHKINNDVFGLMYGVLRFSDRLSLMIVTDELPDLNRKFDINNAFGENHIIKSMNDGYTVKPWPFANSKLDLYFEFRILKEAIFSSEDKFIDAFNKSEIKIKRIAFKK